MVQDLQFPAHRLIEAPHRDLGWSLVLIAGGAITLFTAV